MGTDKPYTHTKHDYFAAAALTGLMPVAAAASPQYANADKWIAETVVLAHKIADAMVAFSKGERERGE